MYQGCLEIAFIYGPLEIYRRWEDTVCHFDLVLPTAEARSQIKTRPYPVIRVEA